MEGALVSASTGVMESVLCKLSFMLGNQYSRNKRVENDVLFLRNELSSMNAVMQKHAMSKERDLQVKAWMKEVRELAYDIEDAIDAFMAQVEEKLDQPTGIKGFVINSIRKLRELVSSSAIAEEIEKLKNQVREISDRRKRYKLDESTSKDTKAEIDPRLPALYTGVDLGHHLHWCLLWGLEVLAKPPLLTKCIRKSRASLIAVVLSLCLKDHTLRRF